MTRHHPPRHGPMAEGVTDTSYALIVVSTLAAIWAATIIWLVIAWERNRRRERDRQRTNAMRSLASRRTHRH
jgi:hypothetical protein